MTRTKGAYEYKEDAEEMIFSVVSNYPKSTNSIYKEVKKKFFSNIHHGTVKRLLENLRDKGKIKSFKVGRVIVWQI